MRFTRPLKLAGVGTAGALVAAAVFLAFSVVVTFTNWPWTTTERFTHGGVEGFEIGTSKKECFDRARQARREGTIRSLGLLDEPPMTYDEKYRGDEIELGDFDRVNASNQWHVALSRVNAWLVLDFHEDHLVSIEKKIYRGPTE